MTFGRIQNEDIKDESKIVADGGTKAQLPNDNKIYMAGAIQGETLQELIKAGRFGGDLPLRLSQSQPTADANLVIKGSEIEKYDGSGIVAVPQAINVPRFGDTTINFQSGLLTGADLLFNGTTYNNSGTIPFSGFTAGQIYRAVLGYLSDGTLELVISTGDTTIANVDANSPISSQFSSLVGTPIGFVYLEATSTTAFKTAGSATNVIENKVGSDKTIFSISSGFGGGGTGGGDFPNVDFPDVDFVMGSNFDLVTQTEATDERGRTVTAPSTILLPAQTNNTENGVYNLTSFKIPDQFTVSGTTSNIEGKTYSLVTFTDGGLIQFSSSTAVENTPDVNVSFFFSISVSGDVQAYLSTDNLSVLWLDPSENAWFGVLYNSAVNINDNSTYNDPNLIQIQGSNYLLWISNAGVTDPLASSITVSVPQPDVVIARNPYADASSDFTESRKVMSDFNVYKYAGVTTPNIGTDPLPFALFSTKYDEQSVSGAVGDLSGGLYVVNEAVATTFGNIENLTLYVKDTDVTFNGTITNCKVIVDNSAGGASFIFDGLIDRSEITVRGTNGSQGELRQNIERSKLTVTSTSNTNSPLRIVNNPGSSWSAIQSQLYFHCYFDTSVTGTFSFINCYIFCAWTMRVQSATTNFDIGTGSAFDIYFLDLQSVSDTSPTINGRGNINVLYWRNGTMQLGGTITIGEAYRRNGASTSGELRTVSQACVNIGQVVIEDNDAMLLTATSESILDIGIAKCSGISNLDGSYGSGVIRIGLITGATFDTNVPANSRGIIAGQTRKNWFNSSGVLGTSA